MNRYAPAAPKPDPRVRRVAQAVAQVTRPVGMYLFGSRARGDYRPDSDIDLFLITQEPCPPRTYGKAGRAGDKAIRSVYGRRLGLDLLTRTRQTCLTVARARNHIVRQVRREGVLMYGEPLPPYEEDETTENGPDAYERMQAAQSALDAMPGLFDNPADDRWIGFLGQQALENALKGYLAALDEPYGYGHDLADLVDAVTDWEQGNVQTPDKDWVKWLNQYAVEYRYAGAGEDGIENRRAFYEEIQGIVASIGQRILALTGRDRFVE